jgi:hypothetical protein
MFAAPGNDFIRPNVSTHTTGEKIPLKNVKWTSLGSQSRIGNPRPSTTSERDIYNQRDSSMGTNSGSIVGMMPRMAQSRESLSEIDKLNSLYTFQEPDQIKRLLSSNKTVTRMVSSIYEKIRKEFISEKIFLEAISDSPLTSKKDIVISVFTSLPVDEAIERLDKVEDVRWNKDSEDPYVDICVKLEYQ